MPYLTVADARLYYQEHGAGAPLVGAAHAWDEGVRTRIRALGANLSAQPGWIDWQRQLHDAVHGADYWQVLYERLRAWADDPSVPPYQPTDLAGITCPVLVVHG